MRKPWVPWSWLIVLTGALSACAAGAGAEVAATEPAKALASETAENADCFVRVQGAEEAADDLNSLGRDAETIVVGVFEGYGLPHWNTADGNRPEKSDYVGSPASLVRPASITVVANLKGDQARAERAVQRGGEIGCDRFEYAGDTVLVTGKQFAFFLVPLLTNEGGQAQEQLILEAFPVTEDGDVETPKDGLLTMEDFEIALATGM